MQTYCDLCGEKWHLTRFTLPDLTNIRACADCLRRLVISRLEESKPVEVFSSRQIHMLLCPFCGGEPVIDKQLIDEGSTSSEDPDAFAYFVVCRSCAAKGGWAKTAAAGNRLWNMRAS
jgi:Lar family restriction alleviation protein